MIPALLAAIMLAAPCPQDVPLYQGTPAPCDGLLVPAAEAERVAVELSQCRVWVQRSADLHAADLRRDAAIIRACETRRDELDALLRRPLPPTVEPWSGWPWVAAIAGAAIGAGLVGLAWYGAR